MSIGQVLEADGLWNAPEAMTVELVTVGMPEPALQPGGDPTLSRSFFSLPSHLTSRCESPSAPCKVMGNCLPARIA